MTRRRAVGPLSVVALLLASLAAADAAAYRTLADDDPTLEGPVRWDPASVSVALYDVVPRDVQITAAHEALRRATSAWTAAECSDLRVPTVTVTSSVAVPGDGRVIAQTLRAEWRARGYSADVAATTDLVLELRGESGWVIADADILINDLDHQWSANPQDVDSERRDLRSVLTHELGHGLAGLAHGCEHGVPSVPECSTGAAFGTTMYPDYLGRSQSNLASDDVAGLCSVYPTAGCNGAVCSINEVCAAGQCHVLCEGRVCASEMVCDSGACTPCAAGSCPEPEPTCRETPCDTGSLGDPCTMSDECRSGACSAGTCALSCTDGSSCPASYACTGGVCASTLEPFGADCEVPSTCASRLCLDTGTDAYCTRTCDDVANCPLGYSCERLDRVAVCAPATSSGCAAGPGASRDSATLAALLIAALLLTTRRGAWR